MSKPSYATYIKDRLAGFGGTGNTFVYQDLAQFPRLEKRVFGDPGRSRRKTPACNGPISVRDAEARASGCGQPEGGDRRHESHRHLHERGLAGRGVAVLPQRPLQGPRDLPLCHRRGHAPRVRDRDQGRHRAADRLPRPRHGPAHPIWRPESLAEFRKRAQHARGGAEPRGRQHCPGAAAHASVLGQLRGPAPLRRGAGRHHRHRLPGQAAGHLAGSRQSPPRPRMDRCSSA